MSGHHRHVSGRLVLALAGSAYLGAACAPAPRPAAEVSAEPTRSADGVTLERGPCFGTCPVYLVSLSRDGSVRFDGRRFVADSGVSTAAVPGAGVDSLLAEIEAAGYFDLADSYRSGDPVCRRYATDLPSVVTEVRLGGRVKRIAHDRGCADAPEVLTRLETRIDEVAGVRRWIGR